jgi:hypothetical protein
MMYDVHLKTKYPKKKTAANHNSMTRKETIANHDRNSHASILGSSPMGHGPLPGIS